jgi:hypothetical protein
MTELEEYYENQPKDIRDCLLFCKKFILNYDSNLAEAWKYKLPFFVYKGKSFAYFHHKRKENRLYIGFHKGKDINHPSLLSEGRKQIKIFLLDPQKDIPIKELEEVLQLAIKLYE